MEINLGVAVYFQTGERGPAVERVIVEPREWEVTHLVTERADGGPNRKLVPISLVERWSRERIVVRFDREELAKMPDYVEGRYTTPRRFLASARPVYPELDRPPSKEVLRQGQVPGVEPAPSAPIELRNGALVEAVDGPVGQLDELLLDTYTNRISFLVISEGRPFHRLRVPVEWVAYIDPTLIRLAAERQQLDRIVDPPAGNYLAETPEGAGR